MAASEDPEDLRRTLAKWAISVLQELQRPDEDPRRRCGPVKSSRVVVAAADGWLDVVRVNLALSPRFEFVEGIGGEDGSHDLDAILEVVDRIRPDLLVVIDVHAVGFELLIQLRARRALTSMAVAVGDCSPSYRGHEKLDAWGALTDASFAIPMNIRELEAKLDSALEGAARRSAPVIANAPEAWARDVVARLVGRLSHYWRFGEPELSRKLRDLEAELIVAARAGTALRNWIELHPEFHELIGNLEKVDPADVAGICDSLSWLAGDLWLLAKESQPG